MTSESTKESRTGSERAEKHFTDETELKEHLQSLQLEFKRLTNKHSLSMDTDEMDGLRSKLNDTQELLTRLNDCVRHALPGNTSAEVDRAFRRNAEPYLHPISH